MTLPDCLTTDEFGGIRLSGTRIGLSQFMWYYREGLSAEGLVSQFPTLGLAQVHAVLAHYWANREDVEEYLRKAEETMEKSRQAGQTVNVQELRNRLASRMAG